MQQILRDKHGKLIGYLRTTGTRTRLVNKHGKLMGFYDSKTNNTLDASGNLYAKGCNVLVALLKNDDD